MTSSGLPPRLRGSVELEVYLALFVVGMAAGFVDSVAGGGGLLTLPALLSAGLPPEAALGTNKLQACFGSGSATWHYGRAGLIDWQGSMAGVGFTAVGAVSGTLLVRHLSGSFLQQLIPGLLLVVALYALFQPRLGEADVHARLDRRWFFPIFGLGLGFYDGFLGPGTGSFWAMSFVLVLGFNLVKATAHTKLVNFSSNVLSLVVFLPGGEVRILLGITMGAGQWLGARLGSRLVMQRGVRFIRPVLITVALAITLRLLWKNLE